MRGFERILLPTDGSERVKEAVEVGLEMAKLSRGTLTALHVLDIRAFASATPGLDWGPVKGLLEKQGEAALEAVREAGTQRNIEVRTKLVVGHPSDEILKQAQRHDLIVMGRLGHSGLSHLLLGSVTEKVIRHAPCPVLIVPLAET